MTTQTERPDLASLLERVRSATGPDREIDKALMGLVYVRDERHIGATEGWEDEPDSFVPVKDMVWVDPVNDKWVSTAAHDFTASIDAALALVERMLPGSVWHVMTDYGGLNRAKVGPAGRPSASVYNVEDRPLFAQEDADTPPLAILAALLSAITKEPAHV